MVQAPVERPPVPFSSLMEYTETIMATYFKFDAAQFEAFLTAHGFFRTVRGHEVVYIRKHSKNPAVHMGVYTSIGPKGQRSKGSDAIRVCAWYDDRRRSWGLVKTASVLRTTSQESIHARVLERIMYTAKTVNARFGF